MYQLTMHYHMPLSTLHYQVTPSTLHYHKCSRVTNYLITGVSPRTSPSTLHAHWQDEASGLSKSLFSFLPARYHFKLNIAIVMEGKNMKATVIQQYKMWSSERKQK